MTPAGALASYRRFLKDRVTVQRHAVGAATIEFEATDVSARSLNYAQLAGLALDAAQGDQKVIVLVDDLKLQGFPLPMARGDVILIQGRPTKVQDVDQNTRKIGQTVIAYECRVRGAR